MNNNNVPVVPALSQAEQLEAMLEVAHRLSVEKRRIIAERDRVVAQHEHTIADRDRVITELRHAIAELQHAIAENERVSIEQRRTIAEQEHTMARFSEQVQILATMAVPAARPSGAEDILDDADSDTGDASADEMAESLQVAKRRRINRQVRDGSEQVISREALLESIEPFVIADIDILARIYEVATDRPLIPDNVEPLEFTQRLAELDWIRRWIPRSTGTGSEASELISLNLLCRSDMDSKVLRQNILRRLGLAGQHRAVVLGPVLCFVLVTLFGIRLDKVTGAILNEMFKAITNKSLRTLQVVTRTAVKKMSADEVCNMVKVWARNIYDIIEEGGGIEGSLEEATLCNSYYAEECKKEVSFRW
ncbi:hypothetical protein GGH94_001316 [Coemansia aciculifera]|uniref:Uncharacterized protein n=1 Tax=Coemansia aciculifera TaxID=417176 RepID=A0A9W8M892_9FUNG|nr:hypothetical protein GGH94_001316 [Coemansia aciculifera]